MLSGGATSARPSPTMTRPELLVGGAAFAVVLLAEASLVLADLRAWSLPGTLALWLALLAGAGALLAAGRPRLRHHRRQAVTVLLVMVVAAVLVLPGFRIGMAGWDPGVYVNHGLAIPRTGAFDVADPTLKVHPALPDFTPKDAARFPAVDSEPGTARSVVGFFHLYPALLAPIGDIAGEGGAADVNPLLGILTVALLALVGWRAFGAVAGTLAGSLAAVNMVQVWHARYPTSEVLAELLVMLALLAILVARDTGWPAAAGVAGLCISMTFLVRADGFLLVLLIGAGLVALAAVGRFDRRCAWCAAGLVLPLPHAFIQAYDLVGRYTARQGVPGALLLGAAMLLMVVTGLVAGTAHRSGRSPVPRLLEPLRHRQTQHKAGITVVALLVLVFAYNLARPLWSGKAPADPAAVGVEPYFNARSLLRLSWFITPLGVVLLVVGLALIVLRRWSFSRWVVILPTLLLLPIYLDNARVSVRLMWWTRRFVPVALPGIVLLIAVGLTGALTWPGRGRRVVNVVGVALTAVMFASWLSMTLPLRGHDELGGSLGMFHEISDTAGTASVAWLWSTAKVPGYVGSANAFASAVFLRRGDPVERFDPDQGALAVEKMTAAFPGRSLLVVVDGNAPPAGLEHRVEAVHTVGHDLPLWELTYDRRPDHAVTLPFHFTIWRVTAAGA